MTHAARIRVGTRGSLLARTQSEWVAARLRARGLVVDLLTISTRGDARDDVPIVGIGGDGVFVRELERALLEGRIDAAVHSLKDLPTAETEGLEIACVPARETPFDAFVGRGHATLESLPAGAVVGTSSIRRVMQLRALRDDLVVRGVRGNVDTRLRRLDDGEYEGLILAGAGLRRLGLAHRISQLLEPDAFWPAIGQGALAVQIRADDPTLRGVLGPLDDPATHAAVRAERSCLAALAGGCLAPIGGLASRVEGNRLQLGACVLEEKDGLVRRIAATGTAAQDENPESLGRTVAAMLVSRGAEDMLRRMRQGGT